ncbi:hypothetical protein AHAT_25550 [Agarivorans sp. Toyoura001]|nr:hypothetical protein AHAT_25550 [Agarivorans sp. Toyoura001]
MRIIIQYQQFKQTLPLRFCVYFSTCSFVEKNHVNQNPATKPQSAHSLGKRWLEIRLTYP